MTDHTTIPRVQAPWRRFFARSFDFSLYTALWKLILALFGLRPTGGGPGMDLFFLLAATVTMLLAEPLLLSKLGTTPGKAIWGLSVTFHDGTRLSYTEGCQRTWTVLLYGEGLCIPFVNLYRNYKSYAACTAGEELPWEEGSAVRLKDTRPWRPVLWLAAEALLAVGLAVVVLVTAPPHNKGDLTVAEFAENFNDLAAYHQVDLAYLLAPDGTWQDNRDPNTIYISDAFSGPDFVYTEEDGVLTGLSYTYEWDWEGYFLGAYRDYLVLALLAYVEAQEDYGIPIASSPLDPVLDSVSNTFEPDIDTTVCGVHILWQTDIDPEAGYAREVFVLERE